MHRRHKWRLVTVTYANGRHHIVAQYRKFPFRWVTPENCGSFANPMENSHSKEKAARRWIRRYERNRIALIRAERARRVVSTKKTRVR